MIFEEDVLQDKKNPEDKNELDMTKEIASMATKSKHEIKNANEVPRESAKIAKKQTIMDNRSPLKSTKINARKASSWVDQAYEGESNFTWRRMICRK